MNKQQKDIDLLGQSIEHWKRMIEKPISCGERPSASHCALCKEYLYKIDHEDECEGCPLAEAGHAKYCDHEIYNKADETWEKLTVYYHDYEDIDEDLLQEWRLAAEDMLDLLEKVRKDLSEKIKTTEITKARKG